MSALRKHVAAFSLIELMVVVGVLLVLAGMVLLPVAGSVRRKATIAASKAQLRQYVTAIGMFRNTYGFHPFVDGPEDVTIRLEAESLAFIRVLSGRDPSAEGNPRIAAGGNRRQIAFHAFSEGEFHRGEGGETSRTQLADRFNNTALVICIDGDGNGRLTVPDPAGSGDREIRASISAYAIADPVRGAPGYCLHD